MGTVQLREELHKYIDQADDRILRLVKGMFQAEKEYHVSSEVKLKAEMIRRAEASEQDIAAGRTISASDFKQKLEDWKQKKRSSTE
ncbi:MAG: hypothetical protein AAF223_11555 [Bacteroidota bacterium]